MYWIRYHPDDEAFIEREFHKPPIQLGQASPFVDLPRERGRFQISMTWFNKTIDGKEELHCQITQKSIVTGYCRSVQRVQSLNYVGPQGTFVFFVTPHK